VWLAALTFGSLAWVATVVGVLIPDGGTFLLALVPRPDWLPEWIVRLAMLGAALLLPAVIGAISLLVSDPEDRPKGLGLIGAVLRGYLLAPALALTLVILALAGTVRKIDSVIHRRTDAHIAIVVRPGRYEALVDDLEKTLKPAELVTGRRPGATVLTIPARIIASIAGGGIRRLVPDRLVELRGPQLAVAIYPSDLALTGSESAVARARAVISRDVRSVDAWFTTSKEAQKVEDRLAALEPAREEGGGSSRSGPLAALDHDLMNLTVPQEEWELLYRRRLQIAAGADRDILVPGANADARHAAAVEADCKRRPSLVAVFELATAALVALDLYFAARRPEPRRRR
ncbi:MAG: hypothetical protein ACAH65_05935, partial [Chloroflexota bacterium]